MHLVNLKNIYVLIIIIFSFFKTVAGGGGGVGGSGRRLQYKIIGLGDHHKLLKNP